jgi:enoyl-[acyl-carrier protein] reductase III
MTATLVRTPTLVTSLNEVQRILSEVTRYPLDILEANADLEEDLGIDSVKLGEVFSVLREHYSLPPMNEMDIPPEKLRSVSDLAKIIDEYTSVSASKHSENSIAGSKHKEVSKNEINSSDPLFALDTNNGNRDTHIESMVGSLNEVQRILSEVTRYPLDILEANADLEEDLGIDSVKLGEVFSVLRERYSLPPMNEMDIPPENLRSVSDLAKVIDEYTSASSSKHSQDSIAGSEPKAVSNGNKVGGYNSDLVIDVLNKNGHSSTNGHGNKNGGNTPSTIFVNQNRIFGAEPSVNGNQFASKPLDGKIALVTGSGRGLGKVIATHLAQLGSTVIVNSFHSRSLGEETAAEIREMGGKALHIWGSVANEDHLHGLFAQIESEFDHLDFFISNSSNGLLAPLEEIKVEHLEKAFQTNVIGLQQGAIHASKLMKKNGGGKIITLSTNAAHRYIPYFGCMATVKAAIEALTKYLAIEFAPYNIQVNCVTSGPVYGELINKWPDSEDLIPYWESISLGNELCYPEDVADLVAYLLREEVKRINGSILLIDAGQTIHL